MAGPDFKQILKQRLEQLIVKSVETDPKNWAAYAATPLKFITSPDDPFIHLFDTQLIEKNLAFMIDELGDNTHWAPNWDWSGNFEKHWPVARTEWSGNLTLRNMILLRNFGKVDGVLGR